MTMNDVLEFLGNCSPEVKTRLACGLLWDSLRQGGQNSFYIRNHDQTRPMTLVVGKDASAAEVADCVENWAREKGLI